MTFTITLPKAILILLGLSAIQFLLANWTKSKIENSIKLQYDKILENYKYELKTRERAEKVATYLALYTHNSKDYHRLNELSMELALWLPADLYKRLGKAMYNFSQGKNDDDNIIRVLMDIRKLLLKDPGDLTEEDIIVHGENVGRGNK